MREEGPCTHAGVWVRPPDPFQLSVTNPHLGSGTTLLLQISLVVHVRDFAYPKSHSYHFGNYPPEPEYEESDVEEEEEKEEGDYYKYQYHDAVSSPPPEQDKTQGHARGLYDFDAETSSELSFREGDCLWIHCRRFPGWFLGEMAGVQGLVPENYVQML